MEQMMLVHNQQSYVVCASLFVCAQFLVNTTRVVNLSICDKQKSY